MRARLWQVRKRDIEKFDVLHRYWLVSLPSCPYFCFWRKLALLKPPWAVLLADRN